jgi:hypothetical protein
MLTPRRHRDPGHAARVAGELYGGSLRENRRWPASCCRPRRAPTRPGATTTIPLVNARIMHRLIPHSQLHVYHGGHLELGAGAERLAPVVEAFLDTDLTAERNRP